MSASKAPKKSAEREINRNTTSRENTQGRGPRDSRDPLLSGCRQTASYRRHPLKAWADPATLQPSATMVVACGLFFLFCPSSENFLDFTYY